MCGIAGIISSDPSMHQQLKASVHTMKHRGPEQSNSWTDATGILSFVHTRLCIIDLSDRASQPFHYADRYVMVYNGELYNYLEVKQRLEQQGHTFISQSDTEVVVASYAAYGKDCLQHFEGMFAFAIWDRKEHLLFAARDRFGEKPFYFYRQDQQFLFASEMKTLWQAGVSREVNEALLYNFLTIGYIANPGDPQETFFTNIHKLPAAHCLTYRPGEGAIHLERYWQLEINEDQTITEPQAMEKLRELLSSSVQKRLRSDVPIGTSLSGGLDSSAIVAFCARYSTQKYSHRCFTAAFPGFDKDESQLALEAAKSFGLEQTIVNLDDERFDTLMDRLMYHQEEPVGSASVWAQFRVFETAKNNGVTVLLDGQGADEIFGGYHKYYRWMWQQLYRSRTLAKTGELTAARAHGISEPFSVFHKAAALLPEFTDALWQSSRSRTASKNRYLNLDFARAQKTNFYFSLPATHDLNGALFYNAAVYGLEELLRYADRNSMAHSVEIRLPFLAHPLVSFLFTLPAHFKIHQGWTKWLLRKTMEPVLPRHIVWRTDKVGFEPPQKKWMQHPQIREQIMEGKKALVAAGVLAPAALNTFTPQDAYAAGNMDWRCWTASYLFR